MPDGSVDIRASHSSFNDIVCPLNLIGSSHFNLKPGENCGAKNYIVVKILPLVGVVHNTTQEPRLQSNAKLCLFMATSCNLS